MPVLTYTPTPVIKINGSTNAALGGDALSLLVEETVEGLYRCEMRFNNNTLQYGAKMYLYFDGTLDFGKEISVTLGQPTAEQELFTGYITAVEGLFSWVKGDQIVALAEDKLQNLRLTRRSRVFKDVTDADVITKIAGEHGLSTSVSVTGETHKELPQLNQSDLAFLRDRARNAGFELWVEKGTLYAKSRPNRATRSVSLTYGTELISFSVRADLAHQCSALHVTGWDVNTKQAIDESSTSSDLGSENKGRAGGSFLGKIGATSGEYIGHSVPLSTAEAKSIAKARYLERARRFVTGTAIADGNPNIRVGRTVTLHEVGRMFEGDYYVTRARHTCNSEYGYRTTFDVERPYVG